MKWLSIEYIKKHSRIEYDCEDDLLEIYGNAAEEMIYNITGRTFDELKNADGKIPAPLMQAGLMLVDNSYLQRSPASSLNMSAVPYTFDLLVKPYMKLTTD